MRHVKKGEDPNIATVETTIKFTERVMEEGKSTSLFFNIDWISGSEGKTKFNLVCGAGCGNGQLSFRYGERQFDFDVRDLVPALILKIKQYDKDQKNIKKVINRTNKKSKSK